MASLKVGQTEIAVVRGSVLEQGMEAIVNAANTGMRGGGALDGAVHRAAGRRLLEELIRVAPDGAETAQAVITGGHDLPQKWVIHVAGPVWSSARTDECDALLMQAYRVCLEAAEQKRVSSLAFPSLSTGVYGFPIERAAPLAARTVVHYLRDTPGTSLRQVLFAMFRNEEYRHFEQALTEFTVHQAGHTVT